MSSWSDGLVVPSVSDEERPAGLKVVRIDMPLSEMKQGLIDYRQALPDIIEYHKIEAELWRKKYQALTEQGFTPAEALQLCCK